jgi:glycosyltransferase involved in cell wall biosynthesis
MHIALLCPVLPPTVDGIGDHTYFLAAALAECARVTVLSGSGNFHCPPGCTLRTGVFRPGSSFVDAFAGTLAEVQPDWLVVQYNPFLYSRRGFNPWLPLALALARRRLPGLGVAMIAHELYMEPENLKFAVLGAGHRLQLRMVAPNVDLAFGSVDVWTENLRPFLPNRPLATLPVGSNIPLVPCTADERLALRARLGIAPGTLVLGSFGSWHYGRMPERLAKTLQFLYSQGEDVHLLFIGSGGERFREICSADLYNSVTVTGALASEEVSRHLQLVDLLLSPFLDGISSRRSSAVSCLAHGLPLLTTSGRLSDALWLRGLADCLVPVEDEPAFLRRALTLCRDEQARQHLARCGQSFFAQHLSWPCIRERLLEALAKPSPRTSSGMSNGAVP